MSGIEVAGLVLGALPLVISFLEHVRGASQRVGMLAHFESENKKSLNDVEDEQLLFRLQLKKLLLPLVRDDVLETTELEELMVDPGADGWKNQDVHKALRLRLGEAHDRYHGILVDMHQQTCKLLIALGCDRLRPFKETLDDLKVPCYSQCSLQATLIKQKARGGSTPKNRLILAAFRQFLENKVEYEGARLKFACDKRGREEIIQHLQRCNEKLNKLLDRSDQVATLQQLKTVAVSPKAVKTLLQYWQHADRVYALLYQSWACPCKASHCAHLWLQHQTSATFEFRVLVLFAPRGLNTNSLPPWEQQGLQIRAGMKVNDLKQIVVPAALTPPPARPLPKPTSILRRRGGLKHSEARGTSSATGSVLLTSANNCNTSQTPCQAMVKKARIAQPDSSPASVASAQEIIDLCNAMTNCGMQAALIGSLTDRLKGCTYTVSSQPEQKVASGETTLHAILQKPHTIRLPRSERFQIALKVASSHLQLQSTRWARKHWQADDVRFPCHGSSQELVLLDRPYVSADFNAAMPADAQIPKQSDRSFACLGIMLLELLFGYTLEEHELWQQLGFSDKQNSLHRLMIARQWADEVEGEAGADFSGAVMWCLNESPMSLEGD